MSLGHKRHEVRASSSAHSWVLVKVGVRSDELHRAADVGGGLGLEGSALDRAQHPGSHVSDRGALRCVRPARRPGKTIRIMSRMRGRQVSISWGSLDNEPASDVAWHVLVPARAGYRPARTTFHEYAHGARRTPGRRDERHLSGCAGRYMDRGETSSNSKSGSILNRTLRHLCELADHHDCRHFRYCSRVSNNISRPSWATLARTARRSRIPECRDCDHRVRGAYSMGSSSQSRAA
jgi:hypothetical protein